jgi:hypothetical protein
LKVFVAAQYWSSFLEKRSTLHISCEPFKFKFIISFSLSRGTATDSRQ